MANPDPTPPPSYPLPTRTEYQIQQGEIRDPRLPAPTPPRNPALRTNFPSSYNTYIRQANSHRGALGHGIIGQLPGFLGPVAVTNHLSTSSSYFIAIRRAVNDYLSALRAYEDHQRRYFFFVIEKRAFDERAGQYMNFVNQINIHNRAMQEYNEKVRQWNIWVANGGTGDVNTAVGRPPIAPRNISHPGSTPSTVNPPGAEPRYTGPPSVHVIQIRDHWDTRKTALSYCKYALTLWREWNKEIHLYVTSGLLQEVDSTLISQAYNHGNQDLNTKKETLSEFFEFTATFPIYGKGCINQTALHAEERKGYYSRLAVINIETIVETADKNKNTAEEKLTQITNEISRIIELRDSADELISFMRNNGV